MCVREKRWSAAVLIWREYWKFGLRNSLKNQRCLRFWNFVENSGSRKSKSEHFYLQIRQSVYSGSFATGALALALLPPVIEMVFLGQAAQWGVWIYRALTFLVISCPCALVISIPLSFFAGIGGASKAGVLIKGSNYMETLSQTKYVMFDKTGTLTKGAFEVSAVHHNELEEEKIIRICGACRMCVITSDQQKVCKKSIRKRKIDRKQGFGYPGKISGHGDYSRRGRSWKLRQVTTSWWKKNSVLKVSWNAIRQGTNHPYGDW